MCVWAPSNLIIQGDCKEKKNEKASVLGKIKAYKWYYVGTNSIKKRQYKNDISHPLKRISGNHMSCAEIEKTKWRLNYFLLEK